MILNILKIKNSMGRGIDLGKILTVGVFILGAIYFNSKITWATRSLTFMGTYEVGIIILLVLGCLFSSKTRVK
ncbi:hypothetical protein WKT22_05099 [Candidatus Lokiarchaeum ossiferum]